MSYTETYTKAYNLSQYIKKHTNNKYNIHPLHWNKEQYTILIEQPHHITPTTIEHLLKKYKHKNQPTINLYDNKNILIKDTLPTHPHPKNKQGHEWNDDEG